MQFDVDLNASTKHVDDKSLVEQFTEQLAQFGGTAEVLIETTPYRVDDSNGFHFEMQRTYRITIPE